MQVAPAISRSNMVQQKFSVDLSKPLAFQVGNLGEAYDEWVHLAIVSKEQPRLYENGLIELMSLTPWWSVPLLWLPFMYWMVGWSLQHGLPPFQLPPTFLAGVFSFSLVEYIIHRFLFHFKPATYWGITLHYMLHGFHHKHPSDTLRLVLSPVASSLLAVIVWYQMKLVIPEPYLSAFFGGALLGYVLYDCLHYYLHHGRSLQGLFNQLKRNHMNHHFRDQENGFGVTSTLWDRVFGTMPTKSDSKYS